MVTDDLRRQLAELEESLAPSPESSVLALETDDGLVDARTRAPLPPDADPVFVLPPAVYENWDE